MANPNTVIEPIITRALLNAADLARILKISKSKAYALIRNGEIATVRMGDLVRVTEEALNDFIARRTIKAERKWPEDYS